MQIIPSQSGEVLRYHGLDHAALYGVQHFREARTVEVGSAPSIIYEKLVGHQAMVAGVAFEDALLRSDLSRKNSPLRFQNATSKIKAHCTENIQIIL